MADIATYAAIQVLNFVLTGGTAVAAPPQRAVGIGINPPNSTSGSELADAGYTRQLATFGAAAANGSASNDNALTFGPLAALATISGVTLWDTVASGAGNLLYYNTLATVRVVGAGANLVLARGALVITMS